MFTDNSTAEAAFWKGTSASPLLFELVLKLKQLELQHDIILHVIHVSGKRMIAQGTDGLSRADHSQGVMQGRPIEEFIPLHLDPFAREPTFKGWLTRVTKGLQAKFLEPEGWYTTGHTRGTFVWAPAPAAAEVVVEQLGRARLKRPDTRTRQSLTHKKNYWTSFNGLCLVPGCRKHLKSDGGIFCGNFFSARGPFAPCKSAWCGPCFVPLGNKPFRVRQLLDEEGEVLDEHTDRNRFKEARAGDHLMTPFQCELCHFRNVYGFDPLPSSRVHQEAMIYFRRANLDAFWSRAPSMVRGNLSEGKRGERFAARMGLPSLVRPMGPFPLNDSMGMLAAAAILDRSLDRGITEEFVQWDTFRGTRSFITNATQAGASGLTDTIGAYEKNRMWISTVPTHSFWFSRFMAGLHKRVGEVRRQDEPITIGVLLAIESILETEWEESERPETRRIVAEMGTWFIAGFCSGLRGEEMLLIEYAGTVDSLQYLADAVCPHIVLVISGRTKGNQLGGAKFGIPIAARTKGSRLQPGKWVKRLCDIMTAKNETKGRLFRRVLRPSTLGEFETDFFRLLRQVQATTILIDKRMEVESAYGILRSSRRGMTAHASNMNVTKDDLQTFNRWNKEMNSAMGAARLDMAETYSALHAIKPLLLRITLAF